MAALRKSGEKFRRGGGMIEQGNGVESFSDTRVAHMIRSQDQRQLPAADRRRRRLVLQTGDEQLEVLQRKTREERSGGASGSRREAHRVEEFGRGPSPEQVDGGQERRRRGDGNKKVARG